jgi:protein-S-isoprenylcysteine O-methyltransferase Ste14
MQNDRWWIWAQNVLTLAALVVAPFSQRKIGGTQIVVGVAIYLAGAILGVLAVRDLGRNRSSHPQPRPESAHVETGTYSLVRHPLYTSLILLTFGWSTAWNSFPGMLAAAALGILLDQKASLEERYLRERFPGYREYAARVKRFLPWLY